MAATLVELREPEIETRPLCGYEDCDRVADWEIWTEPDPYDITFACDDHVGKLIKPKHRNRVYPPGWEA